MNAYAEMKKRHQEEVNALPMYWAFSDEQFDQQLKELGLTRNDTGKLCNEPFARWLVCRERQGWWEDGACVRPNITFRHRKQTEKVRYDDWNETAAYSDTFNPNFREG